MIAVIGAGPAGCMYASHVKDAEVHIFEEDIQVGTPVSCTGILTDSVRSVIGDIPEDLVVSRIRAFRLAAPNGRSMLVDLDRVNMIVDRARFDRFLLQKALDNGAVLHFGESFTGYERRGAGYEVRTLRGRYPARCIVGADGPFSAVAQAAGLYGDRSFVMGWQARCRYPALQPGVTEIRLTLGEFSWIVPEDASVARVGVIGPDSPALRRDADRYLREGPEQGNHRPARQGLPVEVHRPAPDEGKKALEARAGAAEEQGRGTAGMSRNNSATMQHNNDTTRPLFSGAGGLPLRKDKESVMQPAFEKPPRRRPRIGKILVLCVLLFVIVEPIVMYRTLLHQREARQSARPAVELVATP